MLADTAPHGVMRQYAAMTGKPILPPLFALGYHQCRWNYKDEADVAEVTANFDKYDIPFDVLWLDIEHTNGKRYFTWDSALFPDPVGMQDKVAAVGRKMVTITDPHLKTDPNFPVFQQAKNLGYYVKKANGDDFEGHCWPGTSSWLDYLEPKVREY